jgi:hypothetical protein
MRGDQARLVCCVARPVTTPDAPTASRSSNGAEPMQRWGTSRGEVLAADRPCRPGRSVTAGAALLPATGGEDDVKAVSPSEPTSYTWQTGDGEPNSVVVAYSGVDDAAPVAALNDEADRNATRQIAVSSFDVPVANSTLVMFTTTRGLRSLGSTRGSGQRAGRIPCTHTTQVARTSRGAGAHR